jgi:hypothetical protein
MPTYAYTTNEQTYVLYKLYCMCKYEYSNIDVLAQYSREDTFCTGNFLNFLWLCTQRKKQGLACISVIGKKPHIYNSF